VEGRGEEGEKEPERDYEDERLGIGWETSNARDGDEEIPRGAYTAYNKREKEREAEGTSWDI
jgi:hypothetical protein